MMKMVYRDSKTGRENPLFTPAEIPAADQAKILAHGLGPCPKLSELFQKYPHARQYTEESHPLTAVRDREEEQWLQDAENHATQRNLLGPPARSSNVRKTYPKDKKPKKNGNKRKADDGEDMKETSAPSKKSKANVNDTVGVGHALEKKTALGKKEDSQLTNQPPVSYQAANTQNAVFETGEIPEGVPLQRSALRSGPRKRKAESDQIEEEVTGPAKKQKTSGIELMPPVAEDPGHHHHLGNTPRPIVGTDPTQASLAQQPSETQNPMAALQKALMGINVDLSDFRPMHCATCLSLIRSGIRPEEAVRRVKATLSTHFNHDGSTLAPISGNVAYPRQGNANIGTVSHSYTGFAMSPFGEVDFVAHKRPRLHASSLVHSGPIARFSEKENAIPLASKNPLPEVPPWRTPSNCNSSPPFLTTGVTPLAVSQRPILQPIGKRKRVTDSAENSFRVYNEQFPDHWSRSTQPVIQSDVRHFTSVPNYVTNLSSPFSPAIFQNTSAIPDAAPEPQITALSLPMDLLESAATSQVIRASPPRATGPSENDTSNIGFQGSSRPEVDTHVVVNNSTVSEIVDEDLLEVVPQIVAPTVPNSQSDALSTISPALDPLVPTLITEPIHEPDQPSGSKYHGSEPQHRNSDEPFRADDFFTGNELNDAGLDALSSFVHDSGEDEAGRW
jgi:hypothetical protein